MSSKNQGQEPVPDWLLERLAAGELPEARAADVRRRLTLDPTGQARLDGIAASNREILEAHPPAVAAIRVREALSRQTRAADVGPAGAGRRPAGRWTFGLTFGSSAVALGVLALVVATRARPVADPGQAVPAPVGVGADRGGADERIGIKGLQPRLHVYRKVGDGAERLGPGASARAGDRLQLSYVAAGRRFGAVLSIDGAGHVTFHLPAAAGPAAGLRPNGEVALADAYELDAAPGFERFLFIAGNQPFDTSKLEAVARGDAAPPPQTEVVSVTVRKP